AIVARALKDVKAVGDYAGLAEKLAVLVVVQTPRVTRAVGKYFEHMLRGMVAPDPGVDWNPLLVGRARLADAGVGEHTVTAVKPAIRSPGKCVECLVGVFVSPAF